VHVLPGCVQLEHNLSDRVALHSFVGQSSAGDLAAQLFQRLAVIDAAAHGCVQAGPVDVGALRLLEVLLSWQIALQRQYLLAGMWTESDAVGTGRGLNGLSTRASSESPSMSAM
jgi:hypothetical protein